MRSQCAASPRPSTRTEFCDGPSASLFHFCACVEESECEKGEWDRFGVRGGGKETRAWIVRRRAEATVAEEMGG